MKLLATLCIFSLISLSAFSQDSLVMKVGEKQLGKASFYANKFHGRKTASGEKFNMYGMTAAHPTLPFNSIIKVTNQNNDKWVTLRVNDRGPFTTARIVDISKAAALKLDMIKDGGVSDVELEVLRVGDGKGEVLASEKNDQEGNRNSESKTNSDTDQIKEGRSVSSNDNQGTAGQQQIVKAIETAQNKKNKEVTAKKSALKKNENREVIAESNALVATNKELTLEERFKPVGVYNVWGSTKKPTGLGVQLGAYSDINTALELGKEAIDLGMKEIYIQSGWSEGKVSYRVLFAAVQEKEKIDQLLIVAKSKGFPQAFVKSHY